MKERGMITKPFYSIEELGAVVGEPPDKIRDALIAIGVPAFCGGKPAELSGWSSNIQRWVDAAGIENVLIDVGHNYDPHPSLVIVSTDNLPESWMQLLRTSDGQMESTLDSASDSRSADPQRRMNRLRELGGKANFLRGEWSFSGIGRLVKSELAEGRPRSSEKTIREDLRIAAEAERSANREGNSSPLPR